MKVMECDLAASDNAVTQKSEQKVRQTCRTCSMLTKDISKKSNCEVLADRELTNQQKMKALDSVCLRNSLAVGGLIC